MVCLTVHRMNQSRWRISSVSMLAFLICFLVNACSVTGPSAIRNGRLTYNDVIRETDSQQLLMAVLHNRYDEPSNLLAVASVTANVRVSTRADVQIGVGDDDNYTGNLVPFSAGATYEENPTISYIPVAGTEYARRAMSPVPIAALAQLASGRPDPGPIYEVLIASINGINNPDFLHPSVGADPRFDRVITILVDLTQRQFLHWVADQANPGSFLLVVEPEAGTNGALVSELLRLLGLTAAEDGSELIVLPVSLALHGRPEGGVGISTRSVFRLVEILSAAVELPGGDERSGTARQLPELGPLGDDLQIRYSARSPEAAVVAVPYRGGWFYIDETDVTTKRFFRILTALWSDAIASATATRAAAPVLTVPVSR